MSTNNGVLLMVENDAMRRDVDRIAAAVGVRVVAAPEPSPKAWAAAAAVLVDVEGAARCAARGLPRRAGLFVVTRRPPTPAEWPTLVELGTQRVVTLPEQEADLVAVLSEAAESRRETRRRGAVLAVVGARGGAGASVFAAALALQATNALLVDVDPWGGGLDLVLGLEGEPGLRWPDVALQGGRVGWEALRAALPARPGLAVLAAGRTTGRVDPVAVDAVVDAGCRAGVTVVCDVPRRPSAAVEGVLAAADLVVLITPADVRSCASAAVVGSWVRTSNANVGLVVRGPAPGGLSAAEVTAAVGLPRLAAMRAEPGVATTLERQGLRLRPRSALAGAARRVLAVLPEPAGESSAA